MQKEDDPPQKAGGIGQSRGGRRGLSPNGLHTLDNQIRRGGEVGGTTRLKKRRASRRGEPRVCRRCRTRRRLIRVASAAVNLQPSNTKNSAKMKPKTAVSVSLLGPGRSH